MVYVCGGVCLPLLDVNIHRTLKRQRVCAKGEKNGKHWGHNTCMSNFVFPVSGNKLLNKMGLSLLSNTINKDSCKPVELSQARQFHFRHLLRRFAHHVTEGKELTKEEEERRKRLGKETSNFLNMEAYDSFAYTQVLSILTDILKKQGIPQVGNMKFCKRIFFLFSFLVW